MPQGGYRKPPARLVVMTDALYAKSLEADPTCGGLVGYNFLSAEPIVNVTQGIPLIARHPSGKLSLANFMKMQIYSALGSLSLGCELLSKEDVEIEAVYGHGGFFKSPFVGQSAMSAAIGAPVTVMQNAGEGGAWGIAALALFARLGESSLETFLDGVFKDAQKTTVSADEAERNCFRAFMEQYKKGLDVECQAAETLLR